MAFMPEETEVIDISEVRLSSIAPEAPSSRASSYYDEDGTNVAASSFQSIWNRLAAQDLTTEKTLAAETIEKAQSADTRPARSKLAYCICRIGKHSVPTLRSSALMDEQVLIVALSQVPYADSNPLHWELLCSFYKHVIDTHRRPVCRYGSHWERVGFQGEDPATDLRSVGIFGLCQLLFLVSNGLSSQMIAQLFELSEDKVQNFPVAVVGLNFTQFILERMKQGKLNHLAIKENSVVSVVNGIYRGCFITFQRLWKSRNCTILDFANVSNEIRGMIKRRPKFLLNMAVLQQ